MNKCQFTGRLTRDPEIRTFAGGKKVAKFTIAVDRRFKDPSGQWQSDPSFLDFEAWDTGAETIERVYKKGDFILIDDASVKQDKWTTEDGQKRSKLVFRCNHFERLPKLNFGEEAEGEENGKKAEPARGESARGGKGKSGGKPAPARKDAEPEPETEGVPVGDAGDGDIPF